MEHLFDILACDYEVLNGLDNDIIRGVCTNFWLWDNCPVPTFTFSNSSSITSGIYLSASSHVGTSLTVNGEKVLVQSDLDSLKQELAELKEILKDKL